MPIYEYTAFDNQRKRVDLIAAENLFEVENLLKHQKLIIVAIKEVSFKNSIFSKKEILYFTEQLESFLSSSIPLFESLATLAEKQRNKKMKMLILSLQYRIKEGGAFSTALSEHGQNFDLIYCNLIKNAEKTATLAEALRSLVRKLSKELFLKKQIVSAMLYPGVIIAFCFFVVSVLMLYVIPSLREIFQGRALHPFTSIVLAVSNFINDYKMLFFIFFTLLISVLAGALFFNNLREILKKQVMKLPFLKEFLFERGVISFFRGFSALLKSGEPYERCLDLLKDMSKLDWFDQEIDKAKKSLLEGGKLSNIFKDFKKMPNLAYVAIAIAEETGNMEKMMERIAEILEDELEKRIQKITTILQPLLIIIMGVIVGFVVLSVLLPLTDVSSFLDN